MTPQRVAARLLAAALTIPATAAAQSPELELTVSPAAVMSQTLTDVIVTATLPAGLPVTTSSLTLLEYNAAGQLVGTLPRLYDDGRGGDAVAGDGVFTVQMPIWRTGPTVLQLRTIHRRDGQLVSAAAWLPVQVQTSGAESRDAMARALMQGDVAAATTYLGARLTRTGVLFQLTTADRQQLIAALLSCAVTDVGPSHELCEGQVIENSVPRTLHILMVRDQVGLWRILGW